MQPIVTLTTCPNRNVADAIAEALVERRHAACVNIIPGLQSVYRWDGEMQRDEEWLLLSKTTQQAYAGLEACILDLHPDDLPEIITLDITGGLAGYLQWLGEETEKTQ